MVKRTGHYTFLAGVLLAIIAGLVPALQSSFFITALVILGLAVGLLNISEKETTPFLVSTMALMIGGSSTLTLMPVIEGFPVGNLLRVIFAFMMVFVAPAALVVALKTIYLTAEER